MTLGSQESLTEADNATESLIERPEVCFFLDIFVEPH